ncbi:MAG: hypothetical protein OXI35_14380 [Gemmatimonadota bacterium]|nr:hypothetical protein [Gemmatimonadota bacterium]
MTTLYCAILVAGFMATASLADMDPQSMRRDIRIMEGVLSNENLYYDVPDGANFRARGLYLDGYGVLFVAAGPASGMERWDKKLSQAELLAITRDLLAEFLGDYAGTIGQLDQDDRITVCYQPKWPPRPAVADTVSFDLFKQVEAMRSFRAALDVADTVSFDLFKQAEAIPGLRGSRFDFKELVVVVAVPDTLKKVYFPINDEQIATIAKAREYLQESLEKLVASGQIDKSLAEAVGEADSPVKVHVRFYNLHSAAIAATVKKSAIDAFREGRTDSATFRQRIAFVEYGDLRKIDIMAGILDQAFRDGSYPPWSRIQRTLGMYQPDVGALFFISDPIRVANPLPRATVKAKIVEAVADYGAPLRQVQSDEHVIVEYRSPFSARSALLKVPKAAIDAYARGDLDLDAFRKKAVWETQ